MAWYYQGSVTIAPGSNVVTGTGTQWLANLYGIGEGQALVIGIERLEIMYVDSDTSLRLALPHTAGYSGSYHIETSYAGTGGDASRQIMAAIRRLSTLVVDWNEWMTSDAATIIATDAFGHPVEIATYKSLTAFAGELELFKGLLALDGYTVKDKDGVTDVKIDALKLIQQRVNNLNDRVQSYDANNGITWKATTKILGGLQIGSSEYSGFDLVQHTGRFVRVENTPHGAANFLRIFKREADGTNISAFDIPAGIGTAATQQWVGGMVSSNSSTSNRLTSPTKNGMAIIQDDGTFRVWHNTKLKNAISSVYGNTTVTGDTYPRYGLKDEVNKTQSELILNTDGLPYMEWKKNGTFVGQFFMRSGTCATSDYSYYLKSVDGTNTCAEASSPDNTRKVGLWAYNSTGGTTGNCLISAYANGSWSNVQLQGVGSGTMAVIGGNTAFDGSGYLKKSSPIILIRHNGYSTNKESRGATVSKLNTGCYHIKNVLGYNEDAAWGVNGGISVPKDSNGLQLVFVKDKVLADGSIVVMTYHRQHTHLPNEFQNHRIKEIVNGKPVYMQDGEQCDLPTYTRLDIRVGMPEDCIWNKQQYWNNVYLEYCTLCRAQQSALSNETLALPLL